MVIFHSYVSLPKGTLIILNVSKQVSNWQFLLDRSSIGVQLGSEGSSWKITMSIHVQYNGIWFYGKISRFNSHAVWCPREWFWPRTPQGGAPQVGGWSISDWWFGTWFLFFHILGILIPTDELIFFRGVGIPPICGFVWEIWGLTPNLWWSTSRFMGWVHHLFMARHGTSVPGNMIMVQRIRWFVVGQKPHTLW